MTLLAVTAGCCDWKAKGRRIAGTAVLSCPVQSLIPAGLSQTLVLASDCPWPQPGVVPSEPTGSGHCERDPALVHSGARAAGRGGEPRLCVRAGRGQGRSQARTSVLTRDCSAGRGEPAPDELPAGPQGAARPVNQLRGEGRGGRPFELWGGSCGGGPGRLTGAALPLCCRITCRTSTGRRSTC